MIHIHRLKIGAPFVAVLEMTAAEWAAIDPDALVIEAAISQGGPRHEVTATVDPASRSIVMVFDTSGLTAGRAMFDVWINGGPVPSASNVALDLFHGVAR